MNHEVWVSVSMAVFLTVVGETTNLNADEAQSVFVVGESRPDIKDGVQCKSRVEMKFS